ncbi:unnamed protein product [Paramecium sonneborni]|uniref:ZZ-type domain-containing protein n=1 Tax=Paramecium sonneborni TaxID=65129 RepID=A0A8S1KIF3_9CILI|nr:unnamed protein product [Paramecium sonneborni]
MNFYKFPQQTTILVYNTANKEQAQIKITNDFKLFLNSLNEKFQLPSKFTLCYQFNVKDRVIFLACPSDFQLFLNKIQKLKVNNYPIIQIISLKQNQFISKEMIQDAEAWQEKLSEGYSSIIVQNSEIEQLNEEFQHVSISQNQQQDEINYHKCQFCYKDLEQNRYFRCMVCFFFQICEMCNIHRKLNEHSDCHIFILCNQVIDWNKLKQDTKIRLMNQKTKLMKKFKIHKMNIHELIVCDCCNSAPIQGVRYSCCQCPDFDLCQQCLKIYHHDKTHSFIQLTTNIEFIIFT